METEQSWPKGPLRKLGSGSGKPSKFVCGRCQMPVPGVYLVKRGFTEAETWVCGTCRSALTPKNVQPDALKHYQEMHGGVSSGRAI